MIKVGVVGCGYWGPNLIRVFFYSKHAELYALCDLNEKKLKETQNAYLVKEAYTDFDRMLENSQIDAVVIATPAKTHYEFARKALLRKKHVLVEKPLALSAREGEELIKIAHQRRMVLMVGHTFLYNEAVRRIKQYITDGELGDILYIYAQRLNLGQLRKDIDSMWNFAPHDISIINYWLDSFPLRVRVVGYTYLQKGVADVVFMTLDFPKGIGAHIHISWLDPTKIRRMTVVGSKKMAVYDDVSSDAKVQIYDKGFDRFFDKAREVSTDSFADYQFKTRYGDVVIPKIDFKEPLQVECQHFIECIAKGLTPLTDGNNGLSVVRVLEAGSKSMALAGKAVNIPGSRGNKK